MLKLRLSALLFLIATMAIFTTSCDESTDPVGEDPIINSVSPTPVMVGGTLTINGNYFGDARETDYVEFLDASGNLLAKVETEASYVSWSNTKIEVKVPLAAKTGKVRVSINDFKSNSFDVVVGFVPNAVNTLKATSVDDESVRIQFTASSNQAEILASAQMKYEVEVRNAAGAKVDEASINAVAGTTTYEQTFDGMEEGKLYTFEVQPMITNGNSGTKKSIVWSPATRFVEDVLLNVRMYETASDFGSGLQLYDPASGEPTGLRVQNGDKWHVGISTKVAGKLMFGSASALDYSISPTASALININGIFDVNSLDETFMDKDLTNGTYQSIAFDLLTESPDPNTGFAVIIRVPASGGKFNYAKILIKKSGGSFFQGSQPNRYVEAQISYQKVLDVPYAKTIK